MADQLKPYTVIQAIISSRSIDDLQWALNRVDSCHIDSSEAGANLLFSHWSTAAAGNLQALKLLATKHKLSDARALIAAAAHQSHWHVVEYLKTQPAAIEGMIRTQ
jgi:O-acetylhomoserine/O-acetylserine sulfhydrylase-like pyridoxal-dependent enzyme